MRLSLGNTERRRLAVLTLSERNLIALLHKLTRPEAAKGLVSGDCPPGWLLYVTAEPDDRHYGHRTMPPRPPAPRNRSGSPPLEAVVRQLSTHCAQRPPTNSSRMGKRQGSRA